MERKFEWEAVPMREISTDTKKLPNKKFSFSKSIRKEIFDIPDNPTPMCYDYKI